MERKHYLDNLRNIIILFLFPVHTFMIWNDFGQKFYVWDGANKLISTLIVVINPWFMPILFVIAGISMRLSLNKRTQKDFVIQRVYKLLIPFLAGLVLIIPIQTFFTRKFYYEYSGSYLDNLLYFFSHVTDFTGYDGAFTPAHLWFLLFLFLISLIALIVIKLFPYEKYKIAICKFPFWGIVSLFLIVWGMYYLGNLGGFSLGKDLILYLLGYYFLSNDEVMQKLDKYRMVIWSLQTILTIGMGILYYNYSFYDEWYVSFMGWISILGILVAGKRYLNKNTKCAAFFNKASFPIYILHQSILVIIAYYVIKVNINILLKIMIIMAGSFIASTTLYLLIRKIPYLRKILGMK